MCLLKILLSLSIKLLKNKIKNEKKVVTPIFSANNKIGGDLYMATIVKKNYFINSV